MKSSSTVNSSARELELRAESILNAECFRMDQLPYVFNKHSNLAYLFLRRHMEFNDYVGYIGKHILSNHHIVIVMIIHEHI